MAYRLSYTYTMSWIGPGMGPVGSPQSVYCDGNAQSLTLFNKGGGQNIQGSGTGGIIQGADLTTLTNAAAADMAAQLAAQPNLGQMQGWTTGNP